MSGIKNLHSEPTTYTILGKEYHGVRWSWQIAGHETIVYHTDNSGDGIWMYNKSTGEGGQITGTCQFSACETSSGMRRKLERVFADAIEEFRLVNE